MQNMDGVLKSGSLEGLRGLKLVPVVIRYSAGTPSVVQNPGNEDITLTDVGTGEVTVTLANASLSPLIVIPAVRATAPSTLGNNVNIKGAPTASAFTLLVNSDADGATETDPVDLDVLIIKQVVA
jgi:hypothetical protein